MTITMQEETFRVEQITVSGDNGTSLQWNDDTIDLRQVFTIVEWCFNIEWLFRHCDITESQRLELGEATETLLVQTHPVPKEQDSRANTALSKGLATLPGAGLKNNKISPEYTEDQGLRDICKWKYQMCTGKQWSARNRGARRGYGHFLNLWMRLYETIEEGNEKGHCLTTQSCDVSLVAKELNELLGLTAKGRHDCDAVTEFCVKVLDEQVLKRVKTFVDECDVL